MARAGKDTGPLLYPNTYTTSITAKAVNLLLVLVRWILSSMTQAANAQSKAIHKKAVHAFLHSYLYGYTVTCRGAPALYVICELLFLQLFPKALHRGWQNRALIYLNSALLVCSKVKLVIFKLHK